MCAAATECVYHGDRWRSSLQAVCNQMQARYIPRKMMNRISRLVCPCNTQRLQDTQHHVFTDTTCKGLAKWFKQNVFLELSHGLTSVEHIFKKMLCDITPDHVSRIRFLVIVRCAIQENLDLLKWDDTTNRTDKKQKYLFKEETELPMVALYLPYFIGKDGCHIKPMCKQYNCEIRFDIKKYSYLMRHGTDNLKVKININSAADMQEVKDLLIARAKEVTAKREAHQAKVEVYAKNGLVLRQVRETRREERIEARLRGSTTTRTWVAAAEELKDHNRDTFSVKQKHHHEDRKKKTNVLEEGSRCINCLAEKARGTVDGSCRYHPGFLTHVAGNGGLRMWSCCKEVLGRVNNTSDQQGSHTESGCQTTVHNWRPTKNESNKKTKKKHKKINEA